MSVHNLRKINTLIDLCKSCKHASQSRKRKKFDSICECQRSKGRWEEELLDYMSTYECEWMIVPKPFLMMFYNIAMDAEKELRKLEEDLKLND